MPRRARLTVRFCCEPPASIGPLIATAIMAGGLRVSEVTQLRWRDIDLRGGLLNAAASKTAAGVRQVVP